MVFLLLYLYAFVQLYIWVVSVRVLVGVLLRYIFVRVVVQDRVSISVRHLISIWYCSRQTIIESRAIKDSALLAFASNPARVHNLSVRNPIEPVASAFRVLNRSDA